jgi:SAM-dependent methyltransferase
MQTYTQVSGGIVNRLKDVIRLYKVRTRNVEASIEMTKSQLASSADCFRGYTTSPLVDRDVLVVGVGQTQREVIGFGMENLVTGIDLDVIPQGWRPGQYVRLLKQNGGARFAKTVGRKMLGIDRKSSKQLSEALGVTKKPSVKLLQMNAGDMRLASNSFDFAYSFSVFEHLDDPKKVLGEVIRVLKPGGVLQISTHIYTSEGGCHDLRIFAGDRSSIPLWAQLRPSVKDTVLESCYMNKWRAVQWRELFSDLCPGGVISFDQHAEPRGTEFANALVELRKAGELSEYSDEELLMVNLVLTWQKPAQSSTGSTSRSSTKEDLRVA